MMAMSYGYVYVAQVAMGANQAQYMKAIKEAEAYRRTFFDHRLCSVYQSWSESQHGEITTGREESCRMWLLAVVPLQSDA